MSYISRKSVALAATTALGAGALALPAAASAKRISVTAKMGLAPQGGGKTVGTATGTFGRAKASGTAVPPKMITKLKVKGGTVTITVKDGHIKAGKILGTFTLKGTGKYSRLKGKGKMTGNPGTFVFTFKGNATW